jgi:RNA polymerase sigma-70 factor (ECF subfamily)
MSISAAIRSEDPRPRTLGDAPSRGHRIEAIVREHFAFVWRVARRLGLAEVDAEDATQRVLMTASKRLDDVVPGKERAFLFRVVSFEVAKTKRTKQRRREQLGSELGSDRATNENPETLLDLRRARQQLDSILTDLPVDLRAPFVLFEIEGFGQREIAVALGLPEGTVASRLRRAREEFTRIAIRHGVLPPRHGVR